MRNLLAAERHILNVGLIFSGVLRRGSHRFYLMLLLIKHGIGKYLSRFSVANSRLILAKRADGSG